MSRWPAEFEELIVVIALLVLGAGLVVVVARRPDLADRAFLGFTTAVAAIAGHAMGGAGKRRLKRRASEFEDRATTLQEGLRRAHGAALRGDFVPGLTALDSTPQIIAWAAIFGASQQLFTGMVDRQAATVLDAIGGKTYKPRTG
jgi:hypothetical protein